MIELEPPKGADNRGSLQRGMLNYQAQEQIARHTWELTF